MANVGQLSWTTPASTSGPMPYLCLQDVKTSGTEGGTFTSGAWQTRTLNTIHADTHNLLIKLASNQFTLPAGTYRCDISAPAYSVDRHAMRLQNITLGTTVLSSTLGFNSSAGASQTHAFMRGRVRIQAETTFEIQHRCQTTKASNGFGSAAGTSFAVAEEVYTVAEFWREA